jgi:hypothetical protein
MATYAELKAYARRQARDPVGSKADTLIGAAVNDGIGMLARERQWAWFQTHGVLTLQAPYSTGTMTLTSGDATVEFSGTTLPTWTAYGKILYDGKWLRVLSRTDNDTLELTDAWADATATGVSYTLYRDEYTLATDCGRFARLYPGTGWVWGGEPVAFEDILQAYNAYTGSQKYPSMWALYRDKIILWPYPSTSTTVNYMYYRVPAAMTSDADVADWDAVQMEVLYRAIDYQLALTFGDIVPGNAGTCRALYSDALARAVKNERLPISRGPWLGSGSRELPCNISYAP